MSYASLKCPGVKTLVLRKTHSKFNQVKQSICLVVAINSIFTLIYATLHENHVPSDTKYFFEVVYAKKKKKPQIDPPCHFWLYNKISPATYSWFCGDLVTYILKSLNAGGGSLDSTFVWVWFE